MTWQLVTAANLVIAAAYLTISFIILRGLTTSGQLRNNRLGLATGLIFLTCAVHHGSHSVHMLVPTFGIDDAQAMAMREAWHWPTLVWDIFGAGVALFYLSLRSSYGGLLATTSMFEDLKARERQAFEINDNIVQGLARVKWALETERRGDADRAADETLEQAQRMITDLLVTHNGDKPIAPGDLRRVTAVGGAAEPA